MTLHSVKGLEFPLVFLVGMEEGLFPHQRANEEPGRIEEERRLCYVGITRAREQLVITSAELRRLYGNETYNVASRFVREIPARLMREIRPKARFSRPVYEAPQGASQSPAEDSGIYIGQRVTHGKFGPGIVLNLEGAGPQARVQVNFEQAGSKWLMLSLAKLEAL
jgi:DNA helicase-2/ATP-dependent DNA helicase PcrA